MIMMSVVMVKVIVSCVVHRTISVFTMATPSPGES